MSHQPERAFERVFRLVGGWCLALGATAVSVVREDLPAWAWVTVAALGVGIAHSTVFGIVTGNAARIFSWLRRGGVERRLSGPVRRDATLQMPETPASRRRENGGAGQ